MTTATKIHKYQRFKNSINPDPADGEETAASWFVGLKFIVSLSVWLDPLAEIFIAACLSPVVVNAWVFPSKVIAFEPLAGIELTLIPETMSPLTAISSIFKLPNKLTSAGIFAEMITLSAGAFELFCITAKK